MLVFQQPGLGLGTSLKTLSGMANELERTALIRISVAALLLLTCHVTALAAQQSSSDVIRGRVTDDSSHAIVAKVTVTRGPDRLVQETQTDSAGNFSVTFEQGTGDYLVYVSAPGYVSARRRVQRQATERELVANFTLASGIAQLAAVKVTGEKPVRASNTVSPTQIETGSSERWNDGINGQIPPSVAGDLGAIAGTMSNVTMTAGGPSILGAGSESNLNTLNGMGLAAGAIPRAARTETRVTGATFDPTRGGFAGANIDVRLGPGSRSYQRRNGFLTLEPAGLQFTDPSGRALGIPTGGIRASLGADGELIRRALTYNVAIDVARNSSDPATLLNANTQALLLAGIAPDSVARITSIASPLGLELRGPSVPTNRVHDGITWLGRLDDTRDTLSTRALTTYVGFTRDGALGFGPLAAPSSGGERRERTLGGQLTLGSYLGKAKLVLNESRFALSGVHTSVTPYQNIPAASVLVNSQIPDAEVEISSLSLGGGSYLPADDSRWTAEASNQTEWNKSGRRHRFKALLWGRADGLRQQGIPNALGSFSFNSIDALTAGTPSSFSRTLAQPARRGTSWNAAAALAHQYVPSKFFSLLYGARLETDGFGNTPSRNTALEQALGVETGLAPARVHISPRMGFSYMYNRDKDNGSGTSQNPVGRFYRTNTGVIRGGIGEFRDLLRPGILADASSSTGLPGGTLLLNCVGAAVPTPDWTLFAADPGAIPTQCVDGTGALADRSPAVTLIDRSYDVPRSWRASIDWSGNIGDWLLRIGALSSYDLSQPGVVDANFAGVPRFSLSSEGNRPVYVSPASIDPASGSMSAVESRKSSEFGRVAMRVSDLRGYGGQLNFLFSPDVFKFRRRGSIFFSAGYTLQATKREYRGFDGAAFGDPRSREWAAGPNDATHVLVFTGGFGTSKTGVVTLFARAQSGLPFTPIVQGDVNGDGRSGDRAFIPDPASAGDVNLAAQLRSLLSNGSKTTRDCLNANLGRVATRNGCRGPWSQTLNVQWRPPMPSKWQGRVTPNVYFQNVLGGIDQLVHGDNLRGWGSTPLPDPVLLVPRGFDVSTQSMRYAVNPRFADTRPGRTLLRTPFRISIDFSFNLSVPYDLQQLRRAVEPVKAPTGGWERRSADSLAAFYLENTSSIFKVLLEQSDSLFLSATQMKAIARADSVFSAQVRAIYVPLGEFLASKSAAVGKAELDSAQATDKAYWKVFWKQPEIADSLITPTQRELLPFFKAMLSIPDKEREHSQWQFGHPVTFADKPKQPPQ